MRIVVHGGAGHSVEEQEGVDAAADIGWELLAGGADAVSAAVAAVQTSDPQISWSDRFAFFEESISEFPGLANYPRLLLMSQVTNNIGSLNVEELNSALE